MLDLSIREFTEAIAQRTPTPGGGSVGAAAAAMGVGLLAMAARFAQGKQSGDGDESRLTESLTALDHRRELLLPMVERDGAAFGLVSDAYGLPKGTDAEREIRNAAIQEALVGAIAVPEEVLCAIRDAMRAFEPALGLIGRNIVSDVGAGTRLLEAAAEMSMLNVRINAAFMLDRATASATSGRADELLAEIRSLAADNHSRVDELLAG